MDAGPSAVRHEVRDRKLIVNEVQAAVLRIMFERFVEVGSVTILVLKNGPDACPFDQVRRLLHAPEIIAEAWRASRAEIGDLSVEDVREALQHFAPLWDELFPAEQARIIQLLERVDVGEVGVDIRLQVEGLTNLLRDLGVHRADRTRHGPSCRRSQGADAHGPCPHAEAGSKS